VTSTLAPRDVQDEVARWLTREARLLDDLREREWLDQMVSADITYQVPIRENVERARGAGFGDSGYHVDERHGSLEARVARNETEFAWAEDPPSRIRHFVTNVEVTEVGDGSISAVSNVLIYRTYRGEPRPELLSAERQDVVRREDGALRLLRRTVLLDATALEVHNLSLFF
jgi:ethylbenzene dioxygenase beta subunit